MARLATLAAGLAVWLRVPLETHQQVLGPEVREPEARQQPDLLAVLALTES